MGALELDETCNGLRRPVDPEDVAWESRPATDDINGSPQKLRSASVVLLSVSARMNERLSASAQGTGAATLAAPAHTATLGTMIGYFPF